MIYGIQEENTLQRYYDMVLRCEPAAHPARMVLCARPSVATQAERSFEEYLAYLPPIEIATVQVIVLSLLGSVYYTK